MACRSGRGLTTYMCVDTLRIDEPKSGGFERCRYQGRRSLVQHSRRRHGHCKDREPSKVTAPDLPRHSPDLLEGKREK